MCGSRMSSAGHTMPPIRHLPLTLIVMLAIAVIVLVAYDPDDSGDQIEDSVGRVIDGDTVYVGSTATTRSAGRDRLVTMKPTRGTSSPGCHSTLATTRRFKFQLPAWYTTG